MFLYSDPGCFDGAYLIIPDEGGYDIQHQYACNGCHQFEIKGFVKSLEDEGEEELTKVLKEALSCNPWPAEVISMKTGLDVEVVKGEGLLRLKNGMYIATENCD